MMRRAGLLLGLTALAPPAGAQAVFSLPAGCTGYVTVQQRSCQVSNLFTCDGDPPGYQRRVDFDDRGMVYMGVIDGETQWIESFHVIGGERTRLAADPVDPAEFSRLVAEGADQLDFMTDSDLYGLTRYVGEDRLTGESVTIDGVVLQETVFEMTAFDSGGAELWQISGSEFIHPEWRTFLSGTRVYSLPDGEVAEDNSPVEFIFPGEPGFLSATPRHDCGMMMSGATGTWPVLPAVYERN